MIKRFYCWFLQKTARPEDRGGISAGYWQGRIREIALKSAHSGKGMMLDIGCGEGLLLRDLIRTSPYLKVFGIDLSLSQLEEARLKYDGSGGMRLCRADATALPFKGSAFDKVAALNLLINMPSDAIIDRTIEEMARVCKEGGSVMFDIRSSLSPLIYLKHKFAPLYDGTIKAKRLSLTACDPGKIEGKLKAMGFDVVNRTSIGFPKGKFAPVIVMEAVKKRRT